MAASIGSKTKQSFVEQLNKSDPPSQVVFDSPVQPMKLFSEWEGGTSPDCVPRLCTLRIVRLEVFSRLEQDVHDIAICVGMQGSRRSLRSGAVPLELSGTANIELELDFSLQYPHFLKRRGNNLRVMLQRRKKYKRRTILGYKTLAVGVLNMTQVLQGYIPNHLDLYAKGEKASVAKIVLAYVGSQPMDYEMLGRRGSVGNENSSDEEGDDDSYSSEVDDSAGELDSIRPIDRYARQQARIRRKPSKNFKQKIIDMLFKKLKVTDEDLAVIPSELYTDQHDEQDPPVDYFFYEDDDSDPDELFNDALSIASTGKPRLRPYFDQLSRNESQSTLTYDQGVKSMTESSSYNALQRHFRDNESGEDSKELSQSSDPDNPKEQFTKERRETNGTGEIDLSPSKRETGARSSSLKDRSSNMEGVASTEYHSERRKSSAPVPAVGEQIALALSLDESIPETIYLISVKETIGKVFAARLGTKCNKLICTASYSEVQSVLAAITSKFQKFCNKHTVSPPPLKIGVIGPDQYITSILRSYVDSFSPKPADWLCYVRFLVIPFGGNGFFANLRNADGENYRAAVAYQKTVGMNRVASYIANYDQQYNSLFADSFWRASFEAGNNLDSVDFSEVEKRIHRYAQGATSTHSIPIAEALITYKDKGSDGESSQRFIPFLIDVRVGGELETESEEGVCHLSSNPSQLDQPSVSSHGLVHRDSQNSGLQIRETVPDKHLPLTPSLSAPCETHDLQVDYWPSTSSYAPGKKEERKESNKVSTDDLPEALSVVLWGLGRTQPYSAILGAFFASTNKPRLLLSMKTTFRSVAVTRLPNSEFDDPTALSFVANLKARTKGVMRLMKSRENVEAKTSVAALVSNIVCTTKSHGQTFNASIDGCEWPGVKFFSLSPQWPTQVKHFPIGVFGHVETTR